jgi:signal transduction histidine kinase
VNFVAAMDIIALVAFSVAATVALSVRVSPDPPAHFRVRVTFAIAMLLMVFASLSNTLEHAQITSALDPYEDSVEMLVVPLIAYAFYLRMMSRQVESAQLAERLIASEHQLLVSVVDIAPVGILVADEAGSISMANDAARDMLGLELAASGSGAYVCPACPVGVEHPLRPGGPFDAAALALSAPVADIPLRLRRGGEERLISARATPLGDPGRGLRAAVVAVEDVTEAAKVDRELGEYRHGLERMVDARTAQLLEANRLLSEANLAKQGFLANMSHELRTPLNSVIGFTDIMLAGLAGPLNEEQTKQLGMVKAGGVQLLGLVDQVLNLSRIEAGRTSAEPDEFSLKPYAEMLLETMQPLAEARGVSLECHCPDIGAIFTDADKLGQIIRNLVTNAIKFTDAGGWVRVEMSADDGAVRVSVQDNGRGIPPSEQARVFEPFHQVLPDDRVRQPGAGLGLAISRELAGMLRGSIELESEFGRGSTFTLVFARRLEQRRGEAETTS